MWNDAFFENEDTWILPVIVAPRKGGKFQESAEDASYSSHIRNLIKTSGIYALAMLVSPLIALVLAPFLTHNLSNIDYGILAILTTMIALLAGLTQLGLGSAFFRSYSYDYESEQDRAGVLSTVIVLLLCVSLPVTLAVMVAAPWLSAQFLNSPAFGSAIRLAALVMLIQNFALPGFAWMRAENRAFYFSLVSIANLLVSLVGTLFLVGYLHLGIAGALLASGSGYAVVVICTFPVILLKAGLRLRYDIARGLLSYGLPQVSSFISLWVLQLSDRFLLGRLGSLSQTASYSLAYNLGSVLSVVVLSPFQLAWPSALFTIAKKENAPDTFGMVFGWYSMLLLFATFGLALAGMVVLNLFFPPVYGVAAPIIPVIALSIMFNGFYNVFMTGAAIQRKIWFAFTFTTIAAFMNVGLNLVLIPLYGSMGAALATLIAYALLAAMAYVMNQRIYPVPFRMGLFVVALGAGVALFSGSSVLAHSLGTYGAGGISLAALALYGGYTVCLGRFMARSREKAFRK